jgi:hypothetical protein
VRRQFASLYHPLNIVTALFSLGLVVKRPSLTYAEREAITDALAYWERPDGGDLTNDDAIVAAVLRGCWNDWAENQCFC